MLKGMRVFLLSFFAIYSLGISSVRANVVGADTQNFNPITNGLDFVTVHSSETLQPGLINFGLFLNYAVNSLPNYENKSTQNRTNFTDSLLSSDLNLGVGIMSNWDAGLSLPILLAQSVDSDVTTFRGEFVGYGLTEVRMNTKYRFWGNEDQGLAVVASMNLNQIDNNPFTGVDPGPTINLEVAADTTINDFALGGNIGFRWRNSGEPVANLVGVVEPLGNQLIASTAVSYHFARYDTKIIGELFGAVPMEKTQFTSDRDLSSLELLAGVKTDVTREVALHFGGGTKLIHGTSSPDWRVYTGLNWVIGPLFSRPENVIARRGSVSEPSFVSPSGPRDIFAEDPFSGTPQDNESFVARDVLFAFNSDEVNADFEYALERMVEYLRRPPGFKALVIEGHTDSIGNADYNFDLSYRRAESVRQVLVRLGIPREKIRAIGYGETRPIADNGNFQGRAMNRRVEFRLSR